MSNSCNILDCSPPGSFVHGISLAVGVGCLSLCQGIFSTQGLSSGLLHCRRTLYRLNHPSFQSIFFTCTSNRFSSQCFILLAKIKYKWRLSASVFNSFVQDFYEVEGMAKPLFQPSYHSMQLCGFPHHWLSCRDWSLAVKRVKTVWLVCPMREGL